MPSSGRRRTRSIPRQSCSRPPDSSGTPVGAARSASRRRLARVRVLHQLQQPQGTRADRAIRTRRSVSTGHRSTNRFGLKDASSRVSARGVRRVFRRAAARQPARRVGIGSEPGRSPRARRSKNNIARSSDDSRARRFSGRRFGAASACRLSRIEFWYGRPDRLHDRVVYVRESSRLAHRASLSMTAFTTRHHARGGDA